MSAMEIRACRVEDTEAVVALWEKTGLLSDSNNPYADIERKLSLGSDLFLVCCIDGQLVGTLMGGYEGHRGWINYLAVEPDYQHQGIAKTLMATIEKRLMEKGCPKINLQVRSSNPEVLGFYQAIGYRKDDVISLGKRLAKD